MLREEGKFGKGGVPIGSLRLVWCVFGVVGQSAVFASLSSCMCIESHLNQMG